MKQYVTKLNEAVHRPHTLNEKIRAELRSKILNISSYLNRNVEKSFLRCLYCHYVFDDQKQEFENIMTSVQSMGTFVDTDTCIQMLKGEKNIDGPFFHLSFDDGFKNNYTNAFPILQKLGIPAIFFVPSALIGGGWDATAHYCLQTTGYKGVIEMMGWDDLMTLSSEGYEIGSHTRTHARFSDISGSPEKLDAEIRGSKEDLEKRLSTSCKFISWPFGRLKDSDEISLEMAKRSGYSACFGAYRGTISPGQTNPYSIPRHHFEAQWPLHHVKYFARGNKELSR